ncbi:DciA family protein [Thiomicrorhabdus sp.]|uniref:DciA family protein n=1 Tax=Thiomicrorhabdus sp. TaxID=2039724 RepID=UPI002AA5FE96|nr:DciA family protein [Thiomicrorhabdus sp.]
MKPLLNQAQGALKNLLADAQLFQALLEVGQDSLPLDLQPHLIGVSFEKNTLLLQLDESIWATQLRFYEPNLLGIYQEHFPHLELRTVKVHVLPQSPEPVRTKKIITPPSNEDAEQMLEMSKNVKSQGLSKALKSLSLRAKKNARN